MIIIVEPNKDIKKKLCDLVSRERVVSVVAIPDLLEALCRFRTHVDVIVINAIILSELLANEVVPRLCQRLAIRPPPVLGYFTNGQRQLKHKLDATYQGLSLIEYDEQQTAFPERYVAALRELYPAVNVDLDKARRVWQEETREQGLVDIGKWLEEEGFLEGTAKTETKPAGDATVPPPAEGPIPLAAPAVSEESYKELYLELKKKHEELLRYVQELINSIEKPDPGSSQAKQ